MPFFPNYRLGPIDNPGLPCSPVVSTTAPPTPLLAFSAFPNPVSTVLKIVLNLQMAVGGTVAAVRYDGTLGVGAGIRSATFFGGVNVQAVVVGVYFYEIWCEGRVRRVGKVIKRD